MTHQVMKHLFVNWALASDQIFQTVKTQGFYIPSPCPQPSPELIRTQTVSRQCLLCRMTRSPKSLCSASPPLVSQCCTDRSPESQRRALAFLQVRDKSEWASFMRLPECHSHVTMNCEQDFGDGGLGVTLTLRLLMHGKVHARIVY